MVLDQCFGNEPVVDKYGVNCVTPSTFARQQGLGVEVKAGLPGPHQV